MYTLTTIFLIFNFDFLYLIIVFVLNMDSLDLLILIPNLCIIWISLDLQIFIKSNSLYSSPFWINVGISRPSR
jgi:hypothetical protein